MLPLAVACETVLPEELSEFVSESRAEGFEFLGRLQREWVSGENRFAKPGEAFFVARFRGTLAGVCGLNRDPFARDQRVGRLRRLYVRQELRRQGVARVLTAQALRHATPHFDRVRLRTDNAEASRFYGALGFAAIEAPEATHEIMLEPPRQHCPPATPSGGGRPCS